MKGYVIRGRINAKLILCTDGEFHIESLVGPGGWCAKVYKLRSNAVRSYPDNPITEAR